MNSINSLRMIDYNENSDVQNLCSTILAKLIKKHAKQLKENIGQEEVIHICEYGCASGGSSIAPIRALQDELSPRKIRVAMNDLPANDWPTLKNLVEPIFPGVDFMYIPKSMYNAI